MRSPLNNPFTPGSDIVPEIWAGRVRQLNEWRDVVRARRLAGLPERGRTILGQPGLGKSTLVRRIAAAALADGDWVTPQLRIPTGTDPLKAVAEAILGLADHAGLPAARDQRIENALDRVRAVAVSGVSVSLDRKAGPEPYAALTDLLVEVGRAAIRRNVVVLVHLDEVQNITDGDVLSQLLICLGDASTHEVVIRAPGGVDVTRVLPIAVYLTGLPDFADMADARKGATFVRRFATTVLEPLSDEDLALALRPFVAEGWEVIDGNGGTVRVWMEQAAADEIVDLCRGEPFLFQLAGERAWYADDSALITREQVRSGWHEVRREAAAHVERILDRLPQRERDFLEVMAALGPERRTATTIARGLGYSSATQAAPLGQRLDTIRGIIDRGKPYTFRHRALEAYLTSDWPAVR